MTIALDAERAQVGMTLRMVCPECGESDCNLTRLDPTRYAWKCHRAKCGAGGYGTIGGAANAAYTPPTEALQPYVGAFYPLTIEDKRWFSGKGIPWPTIFRNAAEQRYILPIWSRMGERLGVVSRLGWKGSPLYGRAIGPKSIIHKEVDKPLMSWYGSVRQRTTVIVEDQLSAMCVERSVQTVAAVALLGTYLSPQGADEIRAHADAVVFGLDSDATAKSYDMIRRYGGMFKSVKVVQLSQDFKDMTQDQIREVLR